MKNLDTLQMCLENICKNYNISADFHVGKPVRDCYSPNYFSVFIDLHVSNCFSVCNKEILMNILETGIKSKKDYRKLRSLIRLRLIDAVYSLRNLTEESLRNLGVKNDRQTPIN